MESVDKLRILKDELKLSFIPDGMTFDQYRHWQYKFIETLIQYAEEVTHANRHNKEANPKQDYPSQD